MAKIIQIDTYNLLNKETNKRNINSDHVIEVIPLSSYDSMPLTRIKLINGDLIDLQKSVEDLVVLLNGE